MCCVWRGRDSNPPKKQNNEMGKKFSNKSPTATAVAHAYQGHHWRLKSSYAFCSDCIHLLVIYFSPS